MVCGRAHDHRDQGHVSLDHRRVQLDGRGAAGGHHHGRVARRQPQAEGDEPGRALVVVDVHLEPGIGGERDGER